MAPSSEYEQDVKVSHVAAHGPPAGETEPPELLLDPRVEARLRRKIDLYILPTVALLYLFCFIDRANIGNARLAGLEKDLRLTGYDYNTVLTVFYISYIIFEIPSNLACKYFGPGWFIPSIAFAFGICSVACGFVETKAQICGVRFLLGIFEAGALPGIAYYLSRWYRRRELAFRLATYMVMAPMAGAFGGLLASAILTLDGFGSVHSWKMIFVIEGIVTIALALIAFFTLTDRPETARWLTPEEKVLAVARVQSERIDASDVLDKMDSAKILRGIFNPVVLATAFIFLLDNITVQGLAFFTPTIVRTIYPHHTIVQQQLRTVPPYLAGAVSSLLVPFLSGRTDRRTIYFIGSAPLIMIGYTMFLATSDAQTRYGAIFVIAVGAFTFGSLCNAHCSANVVSDTARSSAIGTNVMMGNVGGLISTWAFLPFDGPDFPIGNGLNLATSSTVLIVSCVLLWWMSWDNRKRNAVRVDLQTQELSQKEIEHLDWKHPEFRWRP